MCCVWFVHVWRATSNRPYDQNQPQQKFINLQCNIFIIYTKFWIRNFEWFRGSSRRKRPSCDSLRLHTTPSAPADTAPWSSVAGDDFPRLSLFSCSILVIFTFLDQEFTDIPLDGWVIMVCHTVTFRWVFSKVWTKIELLTNFQQVWRLRVDFLDNSFISLPFHG